MTWVKYNIPKYPGYKNDPDKKKRGRRRSNLNPEYKLLRDWIRSFHKYYTAKSWSGYLPFDKISVLVKETWKGKFYKILAETKTLTDGCTCGYGCIVRPVCSAVIDLGNNQIKYGMKKVENHMCRFKYTGLTTLPKGNKSRHEVISAVEKLVTVCEPIVEKQKDAEYSSSSSSSSESEDKGYVVYLP